MYTMYTICTIGFDLQCNATILAHGLLYNYKESNMHRWGFISLEKTVYVLSLTWAS